MKYDSKVVNKYKVGKHFKFNVRDDGFDFEIDPDEVAAEATRRCKDPELARKYLARCKRHIAAITVQLKEIRQRTQQGRLHGKDDIGVRSARS